MKIKDLPENESLGGVRFIYPGDGTPYYWVSQWQKGVWGRRKVGDSKIYPLLIEDLKEALEWEVVEDKP